MPAKILDGKSLAASIRLDLKKRVQALVQRGVRPGLAVILAGDDPASKVYVRNKTQACEDVGVRSQQIDYPASVTQEELIGRVKKLNADPAVHGILVQLPLPKHVDTARVLETIAPEKDADGFHAANLGALLAGRSGVVPCTPLGCLRLIEHAGVPIAGAHAVVVGRSNIVGKPVAHLLLQRDATVTICHSKTRDLAAVCRSADILVAAIGRAKFVKAEMVKPGACVIDVGINRLPDGKLAGDVDTEAVKDIAGAITPVPGGVGPMTIAMLLENCINAAEGR